MSRMVPKQGADGSIYGWDERIRGRGYDEADSTALQVRREAQATSPMDNLHHCGKTVSLQKIISVAVLNMSKSLRL